MKWVLCIVLLVIGVFVWSSFMEKGRDVERMKEELVKVNDLGDPDGKAAKMEAKIKNVEDSRIFSGIVLTIISALVAGIFIVVFVLPRLAHGVSHALFDSGEMIEKDIMREAHSLLAQGDYEGAIDAFKRVAAEDPANRLPWVEIAKIYREKLQDSESAIRVLSEALEGQEWVVDDAAFFLFRIAELYDEDMQDRAYARGIMQQVVNDFAQTRHSANAAHKLREWDKDDAESARKAEEEAFIARNSSTSPSDNGDQTPGSGF